MVEDRRIALVDRLTAAFADEIGRHDLAERVSWQRWPDVATLIGHLGAVHRWAAAVVRAGERVPAPEDVPAPIGRAQDWYLERRAELLDAMRSTPAESPCWVLAGDDRTRGFWRRRMVFETAKHLIDLRAAGDGDRCAPAELEPADYADGIDELFSVFLRRSRSSLPALPAPVRLEATDSDRAWSVTTDWQVLGEDVAGASRIRATTGDLALVVWERADPLEHRGRYEVIGDTGAVAAFRDASIHP